MADDLKPTLPKGYDPNITVDVSNPGYQKALAVARENGLSQAQFSDVLALEARAEMQRKGIDAPSGHYGGMSFAAKVVASEAMQKAKRR